MHVVVETGPEPVALRVVEDGRDAVRDVDHAPRVAGDHEQEPVRGLQDQVLQLVVGEEGGLVRAVVGRGAGDPPQLLDVSHGHPEDGELVWLAGEGVAGWHHVRELGDVGGHLVPPPPLDLAVVLPGVPNNM